MPTMNRPLTFVVVSTTSPAAMGTTTWLLDVQGPNAAPLQTLGPLQSWPSYPQADNVTTFAYRLVVPGPVIASVSVKCTFTNSKCTATMQCLQCVLLSSLAATWHAASYFTTPGNLPICMVVSYHCAPRCCLQVGNHTFTIKTSTGAITAVNSPMTLYVSAAATNADASSFNVSLPSPAAGATATVTLNLRDRLGVPLTTATAAVLSIQGKLQPQHHA